MKQFKMFNWVIFSMLFTTSIINQSCTADLRTALIKREGIVPENVDKGRALLEAAWQKQGLHHLDQHQTYSFHGSDIWKGLMGKIGKPWPEAESEIKFKYAVGSFDSQAHFENGKRKGLIAGLQNWSYYEREVGHDIQFKPLDKRITFGLSAYHYFFEMLDRLKRAPIISYAGQKTFNDVEYDLIFATWHKPEPHMEHDQYVLWINRETGMLEYAVYSLRDNYLKFPGYKAFYGSIKFADFREIDGILIPHKQIVFLNKPAKKDKKHLHQLLVSDFHFDHFDLSELQPDPDIEISGDSKQSLLSKKGQ